MEYKLEFLVNDELNFFYLNKDVITAGKLSSNDFQLNDNSVSRNHCKFINEINSHKLIDLGSTNGTYVNGKRITDIGHRNYSPSTSF